MCDYAFSEIECKIIKAQIERRAKYRQEFLRLRTDPCKHSLESGFVFDEAHQRFISLKVTQYEFFKPNIHTALFGIGAVIVPMFLYGYLIHKERSTREAKCRSGELRYKDRLFKLS
ncbi:unnamed protein product [Pieris macdunnoughi]|uniref:NADH dehydrogenase [ubiquinone] 1 beta subcomplex subunit 4 n=1 Tax=Pieris macdunnoughi TaxID=345717 RepID=A0A821RUV4_9NEOP|nr:unnamed protein product [Pieris macdunnoughi]